MYLYHWLIIINNFLNSFTCYEALMLRKWLVFLKFSQHTPLQIELILFCISLGGSILCIWSQLFNKGIKYLLCKSTDLFFNGKTERSLLPLRPSPQEYFCFHKRLLFYPFTCGRTKNLHWPYVNHLSKGTRNERSLCERERRKPRWPKTRASSGDEIRFAFTPGKYPVYAVHTKIGKCIFKGGDLF